MQQDYSKILTTAALGNSFGLLCYFVFSSKQTNMKIFVSVQQRLTLQLSKSHLVTAEQ